MQAISMIMRKNLVSWNEDSREKKEMIVVVLVRIATTEKFTKEFEEF